MTRAFIALALAPCLCACAALSEPAPSRIQGPPTAEQTKDQDAPPWWLVALIILM